MLKCALFRIICYKTFRDTTPKSLVSTSIRYPPDILASISNQHSIPRTFPSGICYKNWYTVQHWWIWCQWWRYRSLSSPEIVNLDYGLDVSHDETVSNDSPYDSVTWWRHGRETLSSLIDFDFSSEESAGVGWGGVGWGGGGGGGGVGGGGGGGGGVGGVGGGGRGGSVWVCVCVGGGGGVTRAFDFCLLAGKCYWTNSWFTCDLRCHNIHKRGGG